MTYHFDERPSLGQITSPFPHFLNVLFRQNRPFFFDPEIRCRTHHLTKLITRTIILKTTLFEFPLVSNFSVFPEQKIILTSLIVIGFCASDVFSQVMSLAK